MLLIPTQFFLSFASHVTRQQLSFRSLGGKLWSCQNRWNKTSSLSWGHSKHSSALWHFGIAAGVCCLPRHPSCSQAVLRIMLWTPSRVSGLYSTIMPGSPKEDKKGICSYLGRPWFFCLYFFCCSCCEVGREHFPSRKVNKTEAILHVFAAKVPVPTLPGDFFGRGNLHSISVPLICIWVSRA